MLYYVADSLFASPAQTLVNTVNTVGVMGKGIAKEFRKRYPDMFERYRHHCETGALEVGQLYLHRTPNKWVLNFPTKRHWRHPSRLEWLEAGLRKFADQYDTQGIVSVAFPQLGCGNGGLDWAVVKPLMERHLAPLPLPVFIHVRPNIAGFVPEHETATERDDIRPRETVSFARFLTDLTQLAGSMPMLADDFFNSNSDEDCPGDLPDVVLHGERSELRLPGSAVHDLWRKLVKRGALRLSDFPGVPAEDLSAFADLLRRLSYIETMRFVGGSFEHPELESGIRFVPPMQDEQPLFLPRTVIVE